MAEAALCTVWGTPVPGREKQALDGQHSQRHGPVGEIHFPQRPVAGRSLVRAGLGVSTAQAPIRSHTDATAIDNTSGGMNASITRQRSVLLDLS